MPSQTLTFDYTGADQTWTVPNHTAGTLRVTVAGAKGADAGPSLGPIGRGGSGGSIRGYLTLAPGTTLHLTVGGKPANVSGFATPGGPGGGPFLGGEGGAGNGWDGAGGGCSSDIRTSTSVADRIIVAGGGGGGGRQSALTSAKFGGDGGLGIASGGQGNATSASRFKGQGGFGGTTSAAGAGGAKATSSGIAAGSAGSGGVGGVGGDGTGVYGGGGGGGGYYGGGGGGSANSTAAGCGGGGSSWADTGLVSSIDDVGVNTSQPDGYIIIEWDGDPYWVDRCSKTWTTPGTYTWTVPDGVTAITNVDVAGGQGGADWNGTSVGGKGARVQAATLGVDPGSTLTIIVGGQGGQGVTTDDGSGAEGSGVDGGNGDTLTTLAGGDFQPAGEGRSGGGGGGGVSGIHFRSGFNLVVAGAAGGGGGGGAHTSGSAGGAGAAAPTTMGSNGAGTFVGKGGNQNQTSPGTYQYGQYGIGEGFNVTPAERGHTGRNANGMWTIEGKPGGGGGGGSATSTAGGGGGSRNADRFGSYVGSGGGGGSGTNQITSSYGGYTWLTSTSNYQTGDGYVTFHYQCPRGRGLGLIR